MTTVVRARHAGAAAVAVLVTVLLAACDDAGSPRSRSGTPPPAGTAASGTPPPAGTAASETATPASADASQRRAARVGWSRRIDAVGQPVEAGEAIVVLARSGKAEVELVSLDRRTGRVNFRVPFHPGGLPPGIAMTPRTTRTDSGRHVVVVRRGEPGTADGGLQALDVRSGAVIATTPAAIDDYDACSDGHDVCWSGYKGGFDMFGPTGGGGPTRWDLETGRVHENDGQEAAMLVGTPDLYVRGDGRTGVITRLRGTRTSVWSQSLSLAIAEGVSPTRGWSFEHDARSDVYVGSLGRVVAPRLVRRFEQGKRVELPYRSRYRTVGIDGRTGERLWRRKGADPWCDLTRSSPRVLCVVSGSRVDQQGQEPRDERLAVELQGIDPRDGEVRWIFRVDGRDARRVYADGRAPLAPYGVVLPSDAGPVALDERSGQLQQVDPDAVLLCAVDGDRIELYGVERSAGTLYAPCLPDGRRTKAAPSEFGVAALEGDGPLRVVSMPGRVVAYRL